MHIMGKKWSLFGLLVWFVIALSIITVAIFVSKHGHYNIITCGHANKIQSNSSSAECNSTKCKYTDEDIDSITKWAYKNSKGYIPIEDVREIVIESSKYKSFLMLIAVIREESQFDRYARSSKNALGLGQIMANIWLDTLRKEGIAKNKIDLFYYKTNIRATNYILLKYYKDKKTWNGALKSYVNGSKSYVISVLSDYAELQLLLNGI